MAEGQDKFLGASTSSYYYRPFDDYWNQMTPGNDGKWGSVETVRGQYRWTDLDKIYNYTKHTKILFKEHTLIWGQQQPSWIASLDSADQREAIEKWIQAIGARYPDMALIDVVNEPFHAPPSYKNALGGNGATGWDWIITAFELARQYCPLESKLILNEYNVLHSNSVTTNYLTIINLLQDRGLIDGIGIQGHYFEFRSDINSSNFYVYNINTIKSNLDRLAETGIPVYMTEFDIDEPDDTNQLEQYKIYFPIFWEHPGVKGITLWGYIQGDVWNSHPNTYVLLANGTERPALEWMRTYIISPKAPKLNFPAQYATNIPRDPALCWEPSDSAKTYRVQLASDISFTSIVVDTAVVDTFLNVASLESYKRYFWRVSAANENGSSEFSASASFTTGDYFSTGIPVLSQRPVCFQLLQNHPNPFNSITTISFCLPQKSNVRIVLFNTLGRKVLEIANGMFEAGVHKMKLNASNLTSGIYFYTMTAEDYIATEKLIVLK